MQRARAREKGAGAMLAYLSDKTKAQRAEAAARAAAKKKKYEVTRTRFVKLSILVHSVLWVFKKRDGGAIYVNMVIFVVRIPILKRYF